jgi:hypothetical protein
MLGTGVYVHNSADRLVGEVEGGFVVVVVEMV